MKFVDERLSAVTRVWVCGVVVVLEWAERGRRPRPHVKAWTTKAQRELRRPHTCELVVCDWGLIDHQSHYQFITEVVMTLISTQERSITN